MIPTAALLAATYCFGKMASLVVAHSPYSVTIFDAAQMIRSTPAPHTLLSAMDVVFAALMVGIAALMTCVRSTHWVTVLAVTGIALPFVIYQVKIVYLPLLVVAIPLAFAAPDGEFWSDGFVAAGAAGAWMWMCAGIIWLRFLVRLAGRAHHV